MSMDRIEILSPVHIGTGEIIESPSFHRVGNDDFAYRYNFLDILSQMPASVLTDEQVLRSLSIKQSKKTELYNSVLKTVDYQKLTPLYTVKYNDEDEIIDTGYDVFEQIKDLDKPYIPGSTIKGALLNAWFYYLVKNNYSRSIVEDVLQNKNSLRNLTFINFLMPSLVDCSEFLKAIQSCLECVDIYFEKMEVFNAKRIGAGENMEGEPIPLQFCECIQTGQTSQADMFRIDEFRKGLIIKQLNKYSDNTEILDCYQKILNALTKETIAKACNEFTEDVLKIDKQQRYKELYLKDYLETVDHIEEIHNDLKSITSENKKEFILRVGKNTNYFSKCITYIIKTESPELYEKYFDRVFSPCTFGDTKAYSNSLPKTRVVYYSDYDNFLPGFIKVTYD